MCCFRNHLDMAGHHAFSGIRIVFVVSGTAGRFSIVPLLITIGSGATQCFATSSCTTASHELSDVPGLGLLGVATVLADFFVLNV